MSFKVNYKGLEVICDSVEDLDLLADKLNTNEQANKFKPVKSSNKNINASPNLFDSGSNNSIESFVKRLNPKPLGVIRALVEANRPLTDTELRDALNLESNMQLAGYMSAITKASKKEGFGIDDILFKEILNDTPGKRAYSYVIPNLIRDKLAGLFG